MSFLRFATSEGSCPQKLFDNEMFFFDSCFFSEFSDGSFFIGFADLDFPFGGDSLDFSGKSVAFDEQVSRLSVGSEVIDDASGTLDDFSHRKSVKV
jgi:hypothetical protein